MIILKNTKKHHIYLKILKKKDRLYIGISDLNCRKKYSFSKKNSKIDNDPLIDPQAIIKSNIKIKKNVIILENASIGPNVELIKMFL